MTTESAPRTAGAAAADADGRGTFLAALAAANFTVWLAFFSPVILTIPVKVESLAPDDKAGTLSLVLIVSSVFGLVTNPVAGRLSDRTTSRWGMRRPWLLGGMVTGFAGLVLMAASTSVPVLVAGACVVAVAFAATVTVLLSLLPDHVPPHRRGLAGGLLGVGQAVSVVLGVGLAGALQDTPLLAFTVPAAIGLVAVALLCVVLRDRVLDPARRPPFSLAELAGALWLDPRRHRDFGWAWLSRFLFFMAMAAVINYQVFYLSDQLGIPSGRSARYIGAGLGLQVVLVVLSSALSGLLSDRIGRRKPFVVAAACVAAVSLVLLGLATSLPLYFVAMAIGGVGQGIYLAVDLALVADVLPDAAREAGKDFGVMSVANQLPQTFAPAVAPVLLAVGFGSVVAGGSNYTALFTVSAVLALASAAAVARIRGVR